MSRPPKPRRLTVVHWCLPDGTRSKKGAPGVRPRKVQTRTWYAKLPGDKSPTSLGTEDEGEAWVQLRRLLRERADRKAGIVDDSHRHAAATFASHVEAWGAAVLARGTGAEHVKLITAHVRDLAAEAGWASVAAITADSCLAALAAMRERLDLSAQTRNHYLAHAKQFCAWAVRGKRLRDNPLVGLPDLNVEEDERHPRRMPADEEVRTLFSHLATGRPPEHARQHTSRPTDGTAAVRRWMSGPHRALGYKVAMSTGLRSKELRSLSRRSFDLDAPSVTVVAGYSKRRRKDTLPLPRWLADELRVWFDSGGGCWHHFGRRAWEVLQWDLEAAGIAYQTDEGFFDWHALRVWYITTLAENPDVPPAVVVELARHSDPRLTFGVYARVRRHNLHAAADSIPDPSAISEEFGEKLSG